MPGGGAQADIIELYYPPSVEPNYPNLFIAAQEIIDNDSQSWSGGLQDKANWLNWSFNPIPRSLIDTYGRADAAITVGVNYPGSSLSVTGNGSASSSTHQSTAGSGVIVTFTPAVTCTYHLWGAATGTNNTGVTFTAYAPGHWYYVLDTTSGGFDLTGTLSPGVQYVLNIGASNLTGTDDLFHEGNWNFDLSVQAVPIPATLPLLGSGLVALGAMGLRRRRRS